jgi:hypothetical protein
LIACCALHLAHQKCPRSIDFEAEPPRLPTGKHYEQLLRHRYSQAHKTRVIWAAPQLKHPGPDGDLHRGSDTAGW